MVTDSSWSPAQLLIEPRLPQGPTQPSHMSSLELSSRELEAVMLEAQCRVPRASGCPAGEEGDGDGDGEAGGARKRSVPSLPLDCLLCC